MTRSRNGREEAARRAVQAAMDHLDYLTELDKTTHLNAAYARLAEARELLSPGSKLE